MPGRPFPRRSRKDPPSTISSREQQQQGLHATSTGSSRYPSGRSRDSDTAAYVPPSLDSSSSNNDNNNNNNNNSNLYVTQPPPRPRQGLTGKISTLFRQKSSQGSTTTSGSRYNLNASTASSRQTFSDSASVSSRNSQKRIFYSSHQDDDSDDSYESRVSSGRRGGGRARDRSRDNDDDNDHDDDEFDNDDDDTISAVVRYRGFSTSIQSLFLDEPLVCASMGCFGLILSNRTEYLLELRNERRGLLGGGGRRTRSTAAGAGAGSAGTTKSRLPSRMVAYGLVLTIVLMFSTFLVWGFGSSDSMAADYMQGYDYYDDGYDNNNNNNNGAAQQNYYDDQYNNNNNNANDNEQEENFWDDYLQNNNQNAYNNGYNNNNNQNYYYNDDDGGNNNQNDDGNNNNNDDAGDDGNYNQANNDDDDGGGGGGNDDAYYYYNDDGNRRGLVVIDSTNEAAASFLSSSSSSSLVNTPTVAIPHPLHGIFKLRDYQENLWNPVVHALVEEWNREVAHEKQVQQQQQRRRNHRRRTEDAAAYNNYASSYADDTYSTGDDQSYADDAYSTSESSSSSFSYPIRNKRSRDTGAMVRMALLCTFLLFLAVMGRRRRMRTRFYIVRARAQEDHLYYASSDRAARRRVRFDDTREDQYEGACSHTLCGCYPVDEVEESANDQQVEVSDKGVFRRKKRPHHEDIVARGFNCLMASCCGFLCKCWCQCLSICALAQEAREIRLLLPPRYQRIDFITHQPFHEYQKNVNDLRRGWLGKGRRLSGIAPHYNALSRLSRYIVIIFLVSLIAIVTTLIFNPRAVFSWQDALVLIVTFLQSFLVLFIVHGIFHKSDLSLDAVIKLFAAGFLIAVPTAVFFEGLIVNVMLFFSWLFYLIGNFLAGEMFSQFVFDHWRLIWIIGELFNAYIVAAITEEICKYYTFRAVEHPDLVFITGLQREEQDETAVDGGLVKYPFASHQIQKYIRADDASVASRVSSSSRRSSPKKRREGLLHRTGTTDEEYDEDEADIRTFRQKAMAITTGMISVAVGLACAENFLYVFVLGGAMGNSNDGNRSSGLIDAWLVLFFRSLFPVHALAAAMQSINMIRKFVESDDDHGHRIGIGRVILPAVILHGSFDAVLMAINVFVETSWDNYLEEGGDLEDGPPYNAYLVNLVAVISVTVIMVAGILWYFRENRNQRLRLILLEEREKALVDVETLSTDWNKKIPKPKSPKRRSQLEFA